MLKYLVLFLFAVSCKAQAEKLSWEAEKGYADAFIQLMGGGKNLLSKEACDLRQFEVNFKLYTRENPHGKLIDLKKPDPLSGTSFDVKNNTKILIHDWLQNEVHSYVKDLVSVYLRKYPGVNLITMDYGSISFCNLEFLSRYQSPIANELANLIQALHQYNADMSKIHLIGHGMGAQIAGLAARYISPLKVERLTALNPTFLGYNMDKPQLDTADANLMEVVHTAQRKFGPASKLGHVRFFLNSGDFQHVQKLGKNSYEEGVLSHIASVLYYMEALLKPVGFMGQLCENYAQYRLGHCEKPKMYNVMGEWIDPRYTGNYYMQLDSILPPYSEDSILSGHDRNEYISFPAKPELVRQASQEQLSIAQQQYQQLQQQQDRLLRQQSQKLLERINRKKM